ncbi:putative helicase mov-10-B.1 [Austrofundulus limnaeus]|uniref:RNA helicase n=1 Tax=Austrofundulus limnaeus TaxID=52670 RepID=A0A2I4B8M6_AUSLI|nr:PREDICTED: putative helicase mov-10-B.1 [Austrofundulus limnaeus]
MMSKLKQCLESGLLFLEFLGDRLSNNTKEEIRNIYNNEFRSREGSKHPNFGGVFYALMNMSNKISVKNGKFKRNFKPRAAVSSDQSNVVGSSQQHRKSDRGQKTAESHETSAPPKRTSKKGKATRVIKMMKKHSKQMSADKKGIVITSDPELRDGKVQFTVDVQKESFVVKFHVVNKGPNYIYFTNYTVLDRVRCFTLEAERKVTKASSLLLCPDEHYDLAVRCNLNQCGYFPATICFEFCLDLPKPETFCIVRKIEATVQTSLAAELGPVAPYRPFQRTKPKPPATKVVEGKPPQEAKCQMTVIVKLGDYKCPQYLTELTKHRMEDVQCLSTAAKQNLASVKKVLESPLEMKNYSRRFHLLLHLEEIQMKVDIRKYNLRNQTMTQDQRNKELLVLKVPGVAENRPSVLRGDCLRVTRSKDKTPPITLYTGYVHKVELDQVKLGFARKLWSEFNPKMKFDVDFTFNRLTVKLQHRAVDLAEKHQLKEVLFPSGAAEPSISLPELCMFNRQLEENTEQRNAVCHIVAGSSKPAPYIVFGPPGTGKTVTLVEAITQVSREDGSAHILACAPSNSAADLMCERLAEYMNSDQLYRMYASCRDPNSVPQSLLKYCNWDKNQGYFVFPEKDVLQKYKVIVTTLFTAGRLVTLGIPIGHFSNVFVDEAGQAEEPQCIIAVAGLLSAETGHLVLAGDPKQLGPIIRSTYALKYQFGLSLLERLMKHELYQDFGSRFVTKLLRNYRSHGAILKIPNEEFYKGELQVFADKQERETYCRWEALPQKGFPVIFHGVLGKDDREANSPSFFNVSEIEVLVMYLNKLHQTQGKKGTKLPKISAKDIGIIAPYRKQVEKIRKALRSIKTLSQWTDLKELKVGSVEEFQGQEKKIIMVSTVRSCPNYVKMDEEFNIGFLSNEKRFNVAMTRAKSLLIVVGNPVILRKDPIWEKFISYCVKMKGYVGFDLSNAEEEEDDFEAKMAALKIVDSECLEEEESPLQQFVEPEPNTEL